MDAALSIHYRLTFKESGKYINLFNELKKKIINMQVVAAAIITSTLERALQCNVITKLRNPRNFRNYPNDKNSQE